MTYARSPIRFRFVCAATMCVLVGCGSDSESQGAGGQSATGTGGLGGSGAAGASGPASSSASSARGSSSASAGGGSTGGAGGIGGTGGGGAGGVGGVGGGGGSGGAPTCDQTGDCETCGQCAAGQLCRSEALAYQNNPEALALDSCITGTCNLDFSNQPCIDLCQQQHPNGVSDYQALLECVFCSSCPFDCASLGYPCP